MITSWSFETLPFIGKLESPWQGETNISKGSWKNLGLSPEVELQKIADNHQAPEVELQKIADNHQALPYLWTLEQSMMKLQRWMQTMP